MKTTIIIFFLLILSGCATSSYFLTGGDRSAGSVTLTCNYDLLDTQCEPNYQEMARAASEACSKWGYRDAEAFGGVKKVQTDKYTGYLEMQYQCIGDLEL